MITFKIVRHALSLAPPRGDGRGRHGCADSSEEICVSWWEEDGGGFNICIEEEEGFV